MVEVEVLLFAGAAQRAGTRRWRMELAGGSTVREVRDAIIQEFAELGDLAQVSRWAINNQFVDLETVLNESLQLAMIPPVSGG
ncbi:MAG: MoaD/ThiS family protein [Planctomycetota bacterium]|nr:MoaD/ThiS family protein [Planctomycetota bacterium]